MTKKIRAKMKAPTSDELDKVLNEIKGLNDGQFSVNTNHSCLLEMAEVGKFITKRGQFILYVWSRDGGYVPHFHIGDAETYPKCEKF